MLLAPYASRLMRRGSPIVFLALLASTMFTAPAGAKQHSFDTIFRGLILARIRAYGRGDVRTYSAMLADGFVHISDLGERRTARQMQAYVGEHDDYHGSYHVSSLFWLLRGDLAVVDAEVREHRADIELAQHETDIFVLRNKHWLYLRHQETARWQAPVAVAVRAEKLTDYAGRYRTPSGTIDVIDVRHRTLFDRTLPSPVGEPFVHVARGTFGFSGDPTLAVFLRDAAGKVTQCLWHLPSGQTIVSARM